MGITDANSAGFVHGGMVMKLCDEAAGIAALRHCGRRIVTAAIDRMTFLHPVNVGELVTCRAKVNAVWRTSMEVGVRVEAENPRTGERHHTSTAYLTMVAVDEEGRADPGPPLTVETEDEQRRQRRGRAAPRQPARRARPDRRRPRRLAGAGGAARTAVLQPSVGSKNSASQTNGPPAARRARPGSRRGRPRAA